MKIIDKFKNLSRKQLFIIAFGIFTLVFGVYRIAVNDGIISKGVTVNAVITDVDFKNDWLIEGEHDGLNDYDITYEYNGKTYNGRIRKSELRALDVRGRGDSIWIYIDPENPQRIAVMSDMCGYICIFAAVIFFGTAYIIGCKRGAHYKNYD